MTIVIDNDTGKILSESVAKLPSRAERIAAYQARMNEITSADWDTPDTHYRDGSQQGLEHHECTKWSGPATIDGIGQIGG